MADDKQAPDAGFWQRGGIQQRAEQVKLLWLIADMLGADAFCSKPAVKSGILCRGGAGGNHLGNADRHTGGNHRAGHRAHIFRSIAAYRFGGDLVMHARYRDGEFRQSLAI